MNAKERMMTISPATYRSIIFPAQKHFYQKVSEMGMISIVYFLGDVTPLIGDINKLGVNGLMVEEIRAGEPAKMSFSLMPILTPNPNLCIMERSRHCQIPTIS